MQQCVERPLFGCWSTPMQLFAGSFLTTDYLEEAIRQSPEYRAVDVDAFRCALMAIAGRFPRDSSPRVRGTVRVRFYSHFEVRFIPAGAGNRSLRPPPEDRPPVHPRGCGEQRVRTGRSAHHPVHPRGCGEQSISDAQIKLASGSSPRVRGTDWDCPHPGQRLRFIPAGAGNSAGPTSLARTFPVHPRGCGEQSGWNLLKTPGFVII